MLIEFDGRQHYEPIEFFGGEEKYISRKKNDQIKTNYCLKNNISLLRIPYWDYDNIETILEEKLTELGLIHMSKDYNNTYE
jgi:hypothetical protein